MWWAAAQSSQYIPPKREPRYLDAYGRSIETIAAEYELEAAERELMAGDVTSDYLHAAGNVHTAEQLADYEKGQQRPK